MSARFFKIVFGNLSEGETPLKIDFVFECLERKFSICKVFILKRAYEYFYAYQYQSMNRIHSIPSK